MHVKTLVWHRAKRGFLLLNCDIKILLHKCVKIG